MTGREGRSLDPNRPWPTSPQALERIGRLIVTAIIIQFGLEAFQHYGTNWPMFWAWLVGGLVVGSLTKDLEIFFWRRRRSP